MADADICVYQRQMAEELAHAQMNWTTSRVHKLEYYAENSFVRVHVTLLFWHQYGEASDEWVILLCTDFIRFMFVLDDHSDFWSDFWSDVLSVASLCQ